MKRMITQELINYLASLSETDLKDVISWADEIKEFIAYDVENENLSFPNGFTIPYIGYIGDADGNSYFPSLTDQAGKVVKVNEEETGFEYGEFSGGTQLYQHIIDIDDEEITVVSARSTPSDNNPSDLVNLITHSMQAIITSQGSAVIVHCSHPGDVQVVFVNANGVDTLLLDPADYTDEVIPY